MRPAGFGTPSLARGTSCNMPASSRSRPGGSRKRPADDITPDDGGGGAGPAASPTPPSPNGPVLSFLSPASALLGALQQDDPLGSMSQADKDALTLAVAFCSGVVKRAGELKLIPWPSPQASRAAVRRRPAVGPFSGGGKR